MNFYRQLAEGGFFNLPFLLHIKDIANDTDLFLVNDNVSVTYENTTYAPCSFQLNAHSDEDSSLEIDLVENDSIINMLEENSVLSVESLAYFNGVEKMDFLPLVFSYGSASWSGEKLSLKLSKDDRMGMSFPALIFTTYNNRGNS